MRQGEQFFFRFAERRVPPKLACRERFLEHLLKLVGAEPAGGFGELGHSLRSFRLDGFENRQSSKFERMAIPVAGLPFCRFRRNIKQFAGRHEFVGARPSCRAAIRNGATSKRASAWAGSGSPMTESLSADVRGPQVREGAAVFWSWSWCPCAAKLVTTPQYNGRCPASQSANDAAAARKGKPAQGSESCPFPLDFAGEERIIRLPRLLAFLWAIVDIRHNTGIMPCRLLTPLAVRRKVRAGWSPKPLAHPLDRRLLYTQNPFYLLSVAFVLHSTRLWYREGVWSLQSLAADGDHRRLHPHGRDDGIPPRPVRQCLGRRAVDLSDPAAAFRRALADIRRRADFTAGNGAIAAVHWTRFGAGGFGGLLPGLSIRLPLLFRIPYHLLLVLLFLYPLAIVTGLGADRSVAVWRIYLFCAGFGGRPVDAVAGDPTRARNTSRRTGTPCAGRGFRGVCSGS